MCSEYPPNVPVCLLSVLTECENTPLAFVKAILSLSRIISGHIMWSTPADLFLKRFRFSVLCLVHALGSFRVYKWLLVYLA
jgi:hypothetical protein